MVAVLGQVNSTPHPGPLLVREEREFYFVGREPRVARCEPHGSRATLGYFLVLSWSISVNPRLSEVQCFALRSVRWVTGHGRRDARATFLGKSASDGFAAVCNAVAMIAAMRAAGFVHRFNHAGFQQRAR